MKTIYCTTKNFIHHQGNVVDLGEYRRKLALAQSTSLAPQPEEAPIQPCLHLVTDREAVHSELPRPRRRAKHYLGWLVDIWASLSVVAMTAAFTLEVLFG